MKKKDWGQIPGKIGRYSRQANYHLFIYLSLSVFHQAADDCVRPKLQIFVRQKFITSTEVDRLRKYDE